MTRIPLVSVIVPHYNHGQFLEKRLQSIFGQTYENYEVILLDDASTDNGIQILKRYAAHFRVSHLVVNSVNSGSPFGQWKKGIDLSRGEILWIAESDDWADIRFLEDALKVLNKNPEVGLLNQESNIIDENDQLVDETRYTYLTEPIQVDSEGKKYDGTQFLVDNMLVGSGIYNASGVLFKKEFSENFGEFTNFIQSGDTLFWCHILAQTDIIVLKKKYNYFRRHADSVTFRNYREGWVPIQEMYSRIEYLKDKLDLSLLQLDQIHDRAFNRIRMHIRSMRVPKNPHNLFSDLGADS